MSTPKETKRRRVKSPRQFDPNHVALPDAQLRELVLEITERDTVEAFVRRMVAVMDALRGGQIDQIPLIAGQSRDRSFKSLMAAVSQAVREGRLLAAKNTAFYAASYAYQNSLDYVCGFMGYLDRFNEDSSAPNTIPSHDD
jgi:hypothetical protein